MDRYMLYISGEVINAQKTFFEESEWKKPVGSIFCACIILKIILNRGLV
jgi:hypothetical protein